MPYVKPSRLYAYAKLIIAKMGSREEEAHEVADHLVRANLAGHDSHGIGMLPSYVEMFEKGLWIPNQTLTTVADAGALLIFEAARGAGQSMAAEATRRGIARARELGTCAIALRHSSHIGRIGTYGEQAAAEGMAFVAFVNVADHAPWVATYGGSDPRLGTNPFCAAVPGEGGTPLVLDMATSAIAFGKARVARNKGVPVPDNSLIDERGNATNDPLPIVDHHKGALLPFGLHKGSGLAIMCEILGAALIGGQTIVQEKKEGIVNNMLAFIVDTTRFGGGDAIRREIDGVKGWIKAAPPAPGFDEVLLPGEPERRTADHRGAEGIPVDDKSWADIEHSARRLGLQDAEIDHALHG
ncbi:uncharacterized oxidoreductase [Arboricoccus pini]|uniref:Uncharacterized oxidoreductase n=1 Tax=Arboricoccus pini TaxID=1963835 RepID=A0A212RC49_9PROT|nr:malate/lactate/ureidoglycolate dehydrogenase [Arboricoccus pini]SNB69767.1 uncharacterized oxidoreductase [Arboricoccus pini]